MISEYFFNLFVGLREPQHDIAFNKNFHLLLRLLKV